MDDAVYMTKKEKFHAVVEEVKEAHAVNQPVLVGTITIETSELISKMLRREGIPHQVLNAKFQRSSAPSVMSPAVSTISSAVVPAVRETRVSPVSTFPWKTI